MDEIEYKLESKNPVLISHAISKLFESIKKNDKAYKEREISKVPEFKLLLSKRDSEDLTLSTSVFQALIALVENGLWETSAALSTLTSSISSIKNYTAIATAMCHLLILDLKRNKNQSTYPFTLHVPRHPFIIILTEDKGSWRTVLNQIKFIINHDDIEIQENSENILRPVILYILCNPSSDLSDSCKQQVWQLILTSKFSKLQIEILLWSCTNEKNNCIETNSRILEMAELGLSSLIPMDVEFSSALLLIIQSLTIQLIKTGSDPIPNLEMLSVIVDRCDNSLGNIALALMAEITAICPAIYLYSVFKICIKMIHKMRSNDIYLATFAASFLKWTAYPSVLTADALEVLKKPFREKHSSYARVKTDFSNAILNVFSRSDAYIRFYAEAEQSVNTWYQYINTEDDTLILWLKNLSLVPIDLRDKWKFLICGLFLQTNNPKVTELTCGILVDISREIKSFGSHVLSLILNKLSESKNCVESKHLLLAIPELASTKENVPIVIHTLDTLFNNGKQLKYFAIELYRKTLKKEPRCYRFLSAAIIRTMNNDDSWYSYATCANALKYICENHSEHGEEVVPLLSQILNKSTSVNGSTASALALNSISALCKVGIIGVRSTWRVLAPKMEKEKRTIVLESLCEFFADIPIYPSQYDEKYDQLIVDVVSILWKYVSSNDARVVKSALKALAFYRLEQMPLKSLPEEFRCNLVLPAAYAAAPFDATKKPEDVLPYVPGICWIQMLQKVNERDLSMAGDLLISFIKEEVGGFRSGIYVWPQGEPRNFKYLPERSVIRAVGEYLRRSDKTDSNNQSIIVECLRIFAHLYPKPLPNVNWSFLEETIGISAEAKEYTITIACHLVATSLSARTFTEKYLLKNYKSAEELNSVLENKEYLIFYSSLEYLCKTIEPNDLKPFLEATLDHVIEKMNSDGEASMDLFDRVMNSYARVLRNQDVQEGNSTLLSVMIEKLLDKIDLTRHYYSSYLGTALELSIKHLENMTSPQVWCKITPDKLKNAVAVRAELALKKRAEGQLTWLNEVLDVTATVLSAQTYFFETMQRVHIEMRFERSTINWILELMTQIQGLIVKSPEEKTIIDFYCNTLFLSVICLSGMDCMLTERNLLITSQETRVRLFPQALAILCDRDDWKHIIPQIMEWLNYMRTSSVPDAYKFLFYHSLISLRHCLYYKTVWTKYLSVKNMINV